MLSRNRKLYIHIESNDIRNWAPRVGSTDKESFSRAGSRLSADEVHKPMGGKSSS